MIREREQEPRDHLLEVRRYEAPSADFASRISMAAMKREQRVPVPLWRWLFASGQETLSFNPVYALVAMLVVGVVIGTRMPPFTAPSKPSADASIQAFLYEESRTL